MDFKKINSLKASLFTHLVVALVFSVFISFSIQNIARHVKEGIWLKYIDVSALYEFQNAYSDQFGEMFPVPQVMDREMDKTDRFWVGVCEFVESWSVFILNFSSVYIALSMFYNKRLKKPLDILNMGADKISGQDLDFSVGYSKNDEMGKLCAAFEKMREQLQLNNTEMWNMIDEQKQMRSAFSHDLRTPLSVLKGYVEYLIRYYPQGKLSQEKIMETLEDLLEQTHRIEDFSNTMKEVNRMDELRVHKEIVNSTVLYKKTMDVFEMLAEKYGKEYAISDHFSQEQFSIDVDVYMEIVENIIANAIRYAKSNVRLELWDGNGFLNIMVCDDGRGFSAEELKRATRPYFRGKSVEGCHYGMGLFICKLLCEKHGGYLELFNQTNSGACVRIQLDTK